MNEEQFDHALDGIVNGKLPTSADPLISFARQMHEQEGERMPDDRRSAIWKQLMAGHSDETPTTGGAGPLSQPTLTKPTAFNPWVGRVSQPEPKRSRMGVINDGFQVSVTALAVVAIVIAAFAAFPIIRGDRMPEITPTAFAAAPTTSAPTSSSDMFAMNATQPLIPDPTVQEILPLPDETATPATPHATPDVPIPFPTATDIPWYPYPPVIDPGPAREHGTPGPFTPPPNPPILPQPGEIPPDPGDSPIYPRPPGMDPTVDPLLPAPSPSPETTGVTYRHPQAADCTAEPLTVEEVMAILKGTSSGRGGPNGELRTRQQMDEETHQALAEAQREWLACRIFGSPFQMWALESDEMIRADFHRIYFPMYSMEGIHDTLTQMQEDSGDSGWSSAFAWEPPADTYLPMVPDDPSSSGDAVYRNGSATLTVVWTDQDGVKMRDDRMGIPALEKNLPSVWTFFWDEASGRWLLDGYGVR